MTRKIIERAFINDVLTIKHFETGVKALNLIVHNSKNSSSIYKHKREIFKYIHD